tara:strand:+ start:9401 stop:10558 length:1158 start_codon:yes stop_codon:yes gene_type:complete
VKVCQPIAARTNVSNIRKILIVTSSLSAGGVGRNFLNLAYEFSERKIAVHLFLVNWHGDKRTFELPDSVTVHTGRGRARYDLLALRRVISGLMPDVIISGPARINLLTGAAHAVTVGKCSRVIMTYRSNRIEELRRATLSAKALEFIANPLYRRADAVVGVSKGVTNSVIKTARLDPDRCHTIYNPAWVESRGVDAHEATGLEVLDKKKNKVLIACGRLVEQKDYPTLLHAFAKVLKSEDVDLVILGEGKLRSELIGLAAQLGISKRVHFVGYVQDPMRYMVKADVFVLTSKWEGFGNVIVEALGAGLSVVSTDAPSGPAEILDDGRYGKLVPVGDQDAICAAIIHCLASPQAKHVSLKRARSFSSTQIASEYLRVAEKIINADQ